MQGIAICAVAVVIVWAVANPAGLTGAVGHAGVGLGPAVPVTNGSEKAFIAAVLADLGAPATPADVRSLAAWFPHEFPRWPPAAVNNPMATTKDAPGATIFNSDGVRNYPTAAEGAEATAATIANGWYPLIRAALMSGRGLCSDPGLAGEFLTWSGNGYRGVC